MEVVILRGGVEVPPQAARGIMRSKLREGVNEISKLKSDKNDIILRGRKKPPRKSQKFLENMMVMMEKMKNDYFKHSRYIAIELLSSGYSQLVYNCCVFKNCIKVLLI